MFVFFEPHFKLHEDSPWSFLPGCPQLLGGLDLLPFLGVGGLREECQTRALSASVPRAPGPLHPALLSLGY